MNAKGYIDVWNSKKIFLKTCSLHPKHHTLRYFVNYTCRFTKQYNGLKKTVIHFNKQTSQFM